MRKNFCRAILEDAIRHHDDNPTCCGWVFGGDANCTLAPWSAAVAEVPQIHLSFEQLSFLEGINKKNGDLIVAAGVKGGRLTILDNTCAVRGREMQHDCMYFQWCYKAPAEPGDKAGGAPKPTDDHGERQRLQTTTESGTASSGATEPTRPPKEPGEDEDDEADDASVKSEADYGVDEGELRLLIRTQSPFLKGPMAVLVVEFWEIGLPGGLPPPRPPGSW